MAETLGGAPGSAAPANGDGEEFWSREWSEEERERYLSELGEYDHPLFADKIDVRARLAGPAAQGMPSLGEGCGFQGVLTAAARQPESPHVRALQALADEDSTPADKALRLKQQGNALFKQGQRHFQEAEKAYSEAASYASHTDPENEEERQLYSSILSNRGAVNLALAHPARVVFDCRRAIKLWPQNIKAYFRGATALLRIGDAVEAEVMAEKGRKLDPDNKALTALLKKAREEALSQRRAAARNKRKAKQRRERWAEFVRGCAQSGVRVMDGADDALAQHQEKAYIDKDGLQHWPAIFLYPEHDQSDLVQDLPEDVPLKEVLAMLLPDGQFAPWDAQLRYRAGTVELYAATVGADGEPDRWYKIPDECALAHLLRAPGYVVPGVPVIKVVARDTAFHESFVSALEGSETVLEPTAEIRAAPLDP